MKWISLFITFSHLETGVELGMTKTETNTLNLNVPIGQLTGAEFLQLLQKTSNKPTINESKNYAYGIAGLASIAKCSLPTAQKIKNSGAVPFAQVGRKIIFDVDAVLNALASNKKRA